MPVHKPDLSRLSINQLSEMTGKAYRSVKLALAGLEPIDRDGRALIYAAAEALPRIYGAKAESERERLDRVRADGQELQNLIARGQYAPLSVLENSLSDVASQIRSILSALPKRLKASLPSLRARELDLIKREVVAAQNAMAAVRPRDLD
jgi:phage terminase Nu1 subunit (DNA packaging protein)